MTNETAVSLAPWVTLLQPIVVPVVLALIGAGFTWITYLAHKWFNIQFKQADIDAIKAKAQTIAGQFIAADAKNLAGKSITIDNPQVLAAATSIAAKIPQAMALTGWDSDRIAKLIVGEIGKLQAPQPAVQTVAVVAPMAAPGSVSPTILPPSAFFQQLRQPQETTP